MGFRMTDSPFPLTPQNLDYPFILAFLCTVAMQMETETVAVGYHRERSF